VDNFLVAVPQRTEILTGRVGRAPLFAYNEAPTIAVAMIVG
jgi:hypothetical protein